MLAVSEVAAQSMVPALPMSSSSSISSSLSYFCNSSGVMDLRFLLSHALGCLIFLTGEAAYFLSEPHSVVTLTENVVQVFSPFRASVPLSLNLDAGSEI